MIGWSRRNSESRRRRAKWWATLNDKEREEEERYQAYVGRIWFPSLIWTTAALVGLMHLLQPYVESQVVGMIGMLWPLSMAIPFLFIKTKAKWRLSSACLLDSRGWGPWRQEWYSICSKHRRTDLNCQLCASGSWCNAWRVAMGSLVFKLAPGLWCWWANLPRNKQAWLNSFTKRKP